MSFSCLGCCSYGGGCLSVVLGAVYMEGGCLFLVLGAVYMEREGLSFCCFLGCCLYGEGGNVFLLSSWVLFIWRGGCLSVVLGAVYMEGGCFSVVFLGAVYI